MTKRKKHISEKDFRRYMENKMTDAERNSFEREMQKHPFEAEALEGFQQISTEELSRDLHDLKTGLFSEKRKLRYRYWAAAATILLLITSGILWFQLKDETPVPMITENKLTVDTIEEQVITIQQHKFENDEIPAVKEVVKENAPEIKIITDNKKSDSVARDETKATETAPAPRKKSFDMAENSVQMESSLKINMPANKRISEEEIQDKIDKQRNVVDFSLTDNSVQKNDIIKNGDSDRVSQLLKQNNFVKTSVVAGEDEKPFDTTELSKPAFAKMEFDATLQQNDTVRITSQFQDQSPPGQISIRGLGKPEINEAVSGTVNIESNANVWPKGGMEEFEKYIENKAVLPDEYGKNRDVVKIIVFFDRFGSITGFTNNNQADSTLFERAKKMVENGPEWSPEIRNSMPVNSEKELKIVFRKKK